MLEGIHQQVIPFHDADALGIVWHGHYYKYLEIARTNLLDKCGLTIPFFVSEKIKLVVIESRCRHVAPVKFCEEIRVRAFFKDYEQRLNVGYEIHNLTQGRRCARARTTLVPLIGDEMPLLTPPILRERIEAAIAAAIEDPTI